MNHGRFFTQLMAIFEKIKNSQRKDHNLVFSFINIFENVQFWFIVNIKIRQGFHGSKEASIKIGITIAVSCG
jgi:hypothetical protein